MLKTQTGNKRNRKHSEEEFLDAFEVEEECFIDGERFTLKIVYSMRSSTVKKLNVLKGQHPGVNMLFNTLVDMAITHYYNYIMAKNGSFQGLKESKATS